MPTPDQFVIGDVVAALLAVDPDGLKGAVLLLGAPGDEEAWIRRFRALLPKDAPVRRIPASISEERLVGGLDFAATLALGRVVSERGALAAANGGAIVLGTGRSRPTTWSHVARVLDDGEVIVERDGLTDRHAARVAVIALEERADDGVPAGVVDRVAFVVEVGQHRAAARESRDGHDPRSSEPTREVINEARRRLPEVRCPDMLLDALVHAADSLGIHSSRVMLCALACARSHAALSGSLEVNDADMAVAARLVLAPRAATAAADDMEQQTEGESSSRAPDPSPLAPASGERSTDAPEDERRDGSANAMADIVVRAARAALTPGLLSAAAVRAGRERRRPGKAGETRTDGVRGRQVGVRKGEPLGGARIDLVATLRTAAPFQRLRRSTSDAARMHSPRVLVQRDDMRIRRCVTPSLSTTLFVVDASGSAALARLAEAKGAVELMLTEGYARRERVGLIAFRGVRAELVLAPTHALARARRAIAGLAAGGGTPLASALDLAAQVALTVEKESSQLTVVVMTDGRANMSRDGIGGRPRAEQEALQAARRLRDMRCTTVLIDMSVRPVAFATQLRDAMGARFVRLPSANSTRVAALIREDT